MELYRALPYLGELDDVLSHLPTGASVLELGCGTGRLCARLLAAGCQVTGVDESAEMLALVPAGIDAHQCSIETLDLGKCFDVVLLASQLINHPSQATREAFVRSARRHVAPGGKFLVNRYDCDWLRSMRPGPLGQANGIVMHADAVTRDTEATHITLRYEAFGQVWRQSFSTVTLSEHEVEHLLGLSGFAPVRWYGRHRTWAVAWAGNA